MTRFDVKGAGRGMRAPPLGACSLIRLPGKYGTLCELRDALANDPVFTRFGARMEVSVSALAQIPARRGSGAFEELLAHLLARVADLPREVRRARSLRTATLKSIKSAEEPLPRAC